MRNWATDSTARVADRRAVAGAADAVRMGMGPCWNVDTNVKERPVERGVAVRIGELAERTSVPTRLLRYYEEQELLSPDRAANGYRDYAESLVDRVVQIRGLLEAGLPTKIIQQILPFLDNPTTIHVT